MAKTVIGLFEDAAAAQVVVRELLGAGFRREDVSVMSKKNEAREARGEVVYEEEDGHEQIQDMAKGAGTGAAIGGLAGLFLSLTALAIPGIGPVLAAGPLAAVLAGAGIGATAGGMISGLTRLGVPETDANYYAEGVRRGGTLISVDASDEESARAVGIMKEHGAIEIDKRAAQWRDEGWTGFEPDTSRTSMDTSAAGSRQYLPANAATVGGSRREVGVPFTDAPMHFNQGEVEDSNAHAPTRATGKPLTEKVELLDERVNVERRLVDYAFPGAPAEAFRESLIEIKESHEELVVNKRARVVEEIVVNKAVEPRSETVGDTLRRNEAEAEPLEPGTTAQRK